MGFFGIESTSQAFDQRQSAGDNSNLIHGQGIVTEAGGLTLKGNNKYNTGVFLEKGSNLNTGLQVGKNFKGSITVNDTAALADLAKTSNENLASIGGAGTSAINGIVGQAFDKITGLSESKQTGGASDQNKTVLYIVLAVVGMVAAIFYFRR